jgi:hypothetical protein
VLVAFDRATLPWHAGQVARAGESHGGLVLFRRSVRRTDYGNQARLVTDFGCVRLAAGTGRTESSTSEVAVRNCSRGRSRSISSSWPRSPKRWASWRPPASAWSGAPATRSQRTSSSTCRVSGDFTDPHAASVGADGLDGCFARPERTLTHRTTELRIWHPVQSVEFPDLHGYHPSSSPRD